MTRIRKIFVLLPLLALTFAVGMPNCGGLVLTAQSLPASLHAQWAPNPVGENITKYQLTVDALPAVDEPTTLDPTCTCVRVAFTVATFGAHTAKVRACNLKLAGDPTSTWCGPDSMVAAFTLNQAPQTAPTALAITQ